MTLDRKPPSRNAALSTALTMLFAFTFISYASAAFADEPAGKSSEQSTAKAEKTPEPKRVKHPSGLIVVVLEPGSGPPIKAGQTAIVHYTGWLDAGGWEKGEKFDSSLDRNRPFPVQNVGSARVIQGWNDGIAPHGSLSGMRVGEKRELLIPARLGYGERGAAGGKIPPNARLIFDVELLEIR